jgi:hypothetical protein
LKVAGRTKAVEVAAKPHVNAYNNLLASLKIVQLDGANDLITVLSSAEVGESCLFLTRTLNQVEFVDEGGGASSVVAIAGLAIGITEPVGKQGIAWVVDKDADDVGNAHALLPRRR